MTRYKINPKGREYISNPSRRKDGRITVGYFKNVILMYVLEKGMYKPSEFKDYIGSLDILNDDDWERMPTRNYPEWKHYIDAAKGQLVNLLVNNQDGTFSISSHKIDNLYKEISNWLDPVLDQFKPGSIEQEEYPIGKFPTIIMRHIRDTAMSKKIKEERNYQCQVCNAILVIRGKGYAETHHVMPLGHDGPDTKNNLLVLCPNCHVLFDYGEIAISTDANKTVINSKDHKIATLKPPFPKKEYIEYHFNNIFQKV